MVSQHDVWRRTVLIERISARICLLSEVIKVTETSSQAQTWQCKQSLDDTWHELSSRFCERIREQIVNGDNQKDPSIFCHNVTSIFSRHRRSMVRC